MSMRIVRWLSGMSEDATRMKTSTQLGSKREALVVTVYFTSTLDLEDDFDLPAAPLKAK